MRVDYVGLDGCVSSANLADARQLGLRQFEPLTDETVKLDVGGLSRTFRTKDGMLVHGRRANVRRDCGTNAAAPAFDDMQHTDGLGHLCPQWQLRNSNPHHHVDLVQIAGAPRPAEG